LQDDRPVREFRYFGRCIAAHRRNATRKQS
jgi:hypothetical protein